MTTGPPFEAAIPDAVFPAFQLGGAPIPDSAVAVGGAALITVLIGISAFFSSSEIAMFSLPAHRVEALVEDGVPGSETLAALKSDPHRLLVTILVGNNLVNIAMSSLATGLLVVLGFGQGQAVTIATFGITALVLLFGESAPKSYAVENTESWALQIARPLKVAEYVLLPLVVLFDYLTRIVNKVTGGRSAIETSYVTREEIQNIIETGEREGVLDEEEREMLQRTLRFNDTIAKEVMTPRLDMTAVAKTASVEEALETCIQSGHTHLPVYERSLDNVVGVVHVHDLVRDRTDGERDSATDLSDLVEPVLHVPESKNVDALLTEMRKERIHVVIAIDEFGTTEGLLTIEDLTEEIVGEILEGEEREPIEYVDDETVVVKGEVNVNEVNEALDIDLPEGEEFETVAGSVFNRAGRLVEEGETFVFDRVEISVERVENTRITRARLRRVGGDAPVPAVEAGSESNAP